MRRSLFVAVLLCSAIPPLTSALQVRPSTGASRQRPVEGFACNNNDLTNYTGVVTAFKRGAGETTLTIHTDWDTDEQVTVKHQGREDPSAFFRINGRPFGQADWARIEEGPGVLRPGVRAAAWLCADGQTMIDWNAPRE